MLATSLLGWLYANTGFGFFAYKNCNAVAVRLDIPTANMLIVNISVADMLTADVSAIDILVVDMQASCKYLF